MTTRPRTRSRSGPRSRRRWPFWARRATEIVLVGGAVAFVLQRLPRLAAVGSLLMDARWQWLVCAAGLEALSILALSLLQRELLVSAGTRVDFNQMVPITLASNAVALSIPGGVVVAEGYVFKQYRRVGAKPVEAGWAELAAGAIAAADLAWLALAGALIVGDGLRDLLVGPFTVVVAGASLAAFLFYRTAYLSVVTTAVVAFLERHAPESLRSRVHRVEQAAARMIDIVPVPSRWWIGVATGAVNWLLDALVLAAAVAAVGLHVPWRYLLLVYAGGQVLGELPITPGGLGIVEGGLVGLLGQAHMPAAPATAAVLLYRGFSFWLLIVVGGVAALRIRIRGTDG